MVTPSDTPYTVKYDTLTNTTSIRTAIKTSTSTESTPTRNANKNTLSNFKSYITIYKNNNLKPKEKKTQQTEEQNGRASHTRKQKIEHILSESR